MHLAGFRRLAALAVALAPSLAFAHPGHDGDHDIVWDFSTGFAHPFSGWDHVLAMVAVGLWAAQLGGRARWLIPATFVGAMATTAALGQFGLTIPALEQAIAASVLLLGLLVATMVRLPLAAGAALIALFASFHGLAHGAELPLAANGLSYGAGFVVATALLHAAGFGIGFLFSARPTKRPAQIAGWLIAASGLALLAV
jgi:urease accessory protein